ncbi:MAG: hypothetical protein AAFV85_27960 [Cyanobacteria bacterium J06634_6]
MVTKHLSTTPVYGEQNNDKVGLSSLRAQALNGFLHFLKNIYYGWWDCREAAYDWLEMLQQQVEESEFKEFKTFSVDKFYECLGVPAKTPEYQTPWGRYLERQELINSVLGDV